jgi:hypothetical protein
MNRLRNTLGNALALAAILLLYTWTVASVGGLAPPTRRPAANDYYNLLVKGMVHGHLYLDANVSPALMALPDPYDPRQNEPYRLTDASYYRGHYYLYFGAAPAVVLLLPFKLVTGLYLPTPWAILLFSALGFMAAALTWLDLQRRYFSAVPPWTSYVGLGVIGVGNYAGVLLRRPFFWELAATGGFAFAMLTIAALYRALHSERRAGRWMLAAGIFLGLAVASRPTYVYAVPILAFPLLAHARLSGIDRRWWKMTIAAAAGIGAMGVAVFAYNFARFGSGFEFGHNYLLSIAYESKVRLFSPAYFWFNARMYYFLPGQWSWHAPFFAPIPVTRAEMPPDFYTVDDPWGLLPIFPIALLAVCAPLAMSGQPDAARIRLRAFLVALAWLFVSAGGVILLYVATIPRYAADFMPALALVTTIGMAAALQRWADGASGRFLRQLLLAVAIVSIPMGVLAIFDAGRLLSHTEPRLVSRIDAITSRLEAVGDRWSGVHYGPVEFDVTMRATRANRIDTLLTAGDLARRDRVLLDQRVAGQVRFGIGHGTAAPRWSAPIPLSPGTTHRIRVELGSFYPPLEHPMFVQLGYDRTERLLHHGEISVDGKSVLQALLPFAPSTQGAPRSTVPDRLGHVVATIPVTPRLERESPEVARDLGLDFTLRTDQRRATLPLIQAHCASGADVLVLDPRGDESARLGYWHGNEPPAWSAPFPLASGVPHHLEIRQTETGWALPENGTRLLLVRLDGRVVWKAYVPGFACDPTDVTVGHSSTANVGADFPGLTQVPARDAMPKHGETLLLRVIMPEGIKGSWQPVLATGRAGAADTLSVNYMGLGVAQFRFDHWAAPLIVGRSIPVDENIGHDLEIHFPSLQTDGFGKPQSGEVWVKLDGTEVLRAPAAAFGFAPEEFHLGENHAHATMDDNWFRGYFVRQEWLAGD